MEEVIACVSYLTSQENWNRNEETADSTNSAHTRLLQIFVAPENRKNTELQR